jgi:hypothetical protein
MILVKKNYKHGHLGCVWPMYYSDNFSFFAWRPDMPEHNQHKEHDGSRPANLPLAFFACPNSDCAYFSQFDAGNLSIAEWMGK